MSEKHEYRKRFYDLEKEEQWLNEMSEKGLAMKEIKCGIFKDTYYFEPCDKKYIFRIDYNSEAPVLEEITSPHVMFVTSTYEAEFLVCRREKVYFRKAEENGDFPPIYTSLESRIAAEKKWFRNYLILAMTCVFTELWWRWGYNSIQILRAGFAVSGICFLPAAVANIYLIVYCVVRAFRHYKKINELKNR